MRIERDVILEIFANDEHWKYAHFYTSIAVYWFLDAILKICERPKVK